MFWTLVQKEFLENVLGSRFVISAILCLLLVLASLLVLQEDYAAKKKNFETNTTIYREQAQQEGSYRMLKEHGTRVDRPPPVLQVSVYGLEKEPDRTARVETVGVPKMVHEQEVNPIVSMFPVADMLFVVATVLSLMAFVLSYDAVSGERENGTLKLYMSYSVPRDMVILAKWLGGYLSAVLPFVAAGLVGAIIIMVSPKVNFSASDWGAYVAVLMVSLVLLAVMFSLGLFVSTLCRYPSTAISILVSIWVVFVLVVPNTSPYVANQTAPIQPQSVVESDIRQASEVLRQELRDKSSDERRKRGIRFGPQRGGDRKGGGPSRPNQPVQMDDAAKAAIAEFNEWYADETAKVAEKITKTEEEKIAAFTRAQQHQILVTKNFSRLSPIASYVYTATDLAGTGIRSQSTFTEALRRYQKEFERYVERKMVETGESSTSMSMFGGGPPGGGSPGGGPGGPMRPQSSTLDVSEMPSMSFTHGQLKDRISGSMLDLGIMSIYTVFFFIGSFVSFIRQEII